MKRLIFIFSLIVGIAQFTFGQLSEKGTPYVKRSGLDRQIPYLSLKTQTPEEVQSGKEAFRPLYAGYTISIGEELFEKGREDELKQNYVWRIGITIEQAEGINFYFKNVNLADDDKIFIYDNQAESVLGAFTSKNNGPFLATSFIPGDSVVIEFSSSKPILVLPFELDRAGVSVHHINKSERDFGDSESCEVLVNCPEGDEWQREKRGVARILVTAGNSLFWCSGSLVNNTNQDGTPYFLTANHCADGADATDISNWVFYFNFESNNCLMPVFEPDVQSLSGASVLARGQGGVSNSSDFLLLLLDNQLPDDFYPYYNGWDRGGKASPHGVGIHHPEGDLKMISTYDNPLVSTNYNNVTPNPDGKFWKVIWSPTSSGYGVTEGGSSGSPIFDPTGHIVGTLSGGKASCTATGQPDYYGKFSYSWESNGDGPLEQLKPWLDPLETGVEVLDGSDLDSSDLKAGFDASPTKIIVGQTVYFQNKSEGDISEFYWEFPGGDPSYSESANPEPIRYNKVGLYNAKLVIRSGKGSDSLVRQQYIEVRPNLFPNPSSGNFNLFFGSDLPREYNLLVINMLGQEITYTQNSIATNGININLETKYSGLYLIYIEGDGINMKLKALVVH